MKRVWVVCHIDNKYHKNLQSELNRHGYSDIRVYVPTVSILKKMHKGKNIYEDVPMLFSYGFLKMSVERANSRTFLMKLKKEIYGIHSWVKSLDHMVRKIKRRTDNPEDWDDFSVVSTISRKDIEYFRKLQKDNKVFANNEIARLTIGSYIVLRGYPYEGLEARIDEVIPSSQSVLVTILGKNLTMSATLSYENVIYSIYHDFDAESLHYAHNEDPEVNTDKLKYEEEWSD